MTHEPPGSSDPSGGTGRPPPAGMPRWVKAFIVIAAIVVLAFLVSRLAGVEHGPGLHTSAEDGSGYSPPVALPA